MDGVRQWFAGAPLFFLPDLLSALDAVHGGLLRGNLEIGKRLDDVFERLSVAARRVIAQRQADSGAVYPDHARHL